MGFNGGTVLVLVDSVAAFLSVSEADEAIDSSQSKGKYKSQLYSSSSSSPSPAVK